MNAPLEIIKTSAWFAVVRALVTPSIVSSVRDWRKTETDVLRSSIWEAAGPIYSTKRRVSGIIDLCSARVMPATRDGILGFETLDYRHKDQRCRKWQRDGTNILGR